MEIMAKVTDYNLIASTIAEVMPEVCPDLPAKIGQDNAIWCVMGVYLTNDQTSGHGQDFRCLDSTPETGNVICLSVISSKDRISIVENGQMSYYKDNVDLCGYEDLQEDIYAICMYIQTAIDRINAR